MNKKDCLVFDEWDSEADGYLGGVTGIRGAVRESEPLPLKSEI